MLSACAITGLLTLGSLTALLIIAISLALPTWLSALIVTVMWAAAAAILALAGKNKIQDAGPPIPEQTIKNVKEDVVFVEIAGLVIHDHQHVLNMVFGYLQRDAGSGAAAVRQIVAATFNQPRKGIVAEIIGWIVFILAAVGLFGAVQFALNSVWDIVPKKMTLKDTIRQRASSFGVLLGIAFVLLLSMGVNALLTMMSAYFMHIFPGFAALMKIADFAISFGVLWAAFALL